MVLVHDDVEAVGESSLGEREIDAGERHSKQSYRLTGRRLRIYPTPGILRLSLNLFGGPGILTIRFRFPGSCIFAILFVFFAVPTTAQVSEPSSGPATPTDQPPDPEAQAAATEVEKLRSGEPEQIEVSEQRRQALGLAPSAVGVYRRASPGVSLAGYGEVLLENFNSENESGAGGAPTRQRVPRTERVPRCKASGNRAAHYPLHVA
jgi:hypothetical protein